MANEATNQYGRFSRYRGILLLVSGAVLIWLLGSFLKPLLMGGIFAAILYPLMNAKWLWRPRRLSPAVRATFLTLSFAVAFLLPFGLLIVAGADAALDKIRDLTGIASDAGGKLTTADGVLDALGLHSWLEYVERVTPLSDAQLRAILTRGVQTVGGYVVNFLQATLAGIPGALASAFVILVAVFFFLVDGPRVVAFLRKNSFFGPKDTETIIETASALCSSVLLASIITGAVQGGLLAAACMITGIGNPFLVALVALIASFLPVVGTAPVSITLTIMGFASGNTGAGVVFLVFLFIVGIADNIVRPYVLKGGGEMHPLVAFVAAFGALDAIGFYGLFIGPVMAGLFFTILPMVIRENRESKAQS